jgi:hypothetical protein
VAIEEWLKVHELEETTREAQAPAASPSERHSDSCDISRRQSTHTGKRPRTRARCCRNTSRCPRMVPGSESSRSTLSLCGEQPRAKGRSGRLRAAGSRTADRQVNRMRVYREAPAACMIAVTERRGHRNCGGGAA